MASAPSAIAEDDFLCSICRSVFTKPVSIPCGHSFCLDCIQNYWDTLDTVFPCPMCKEEFRGRPTLRVNTAIDQLTAKFQETYREKSADATERAGNVLCDVCNICEGVKLLALKSCLVCFMSYCETHLKPHQKCSPLKKHKLIDAVENLKSRMCPAHDEEPLELFCVADQAFVCKSCKDGDHKAHKIVTVEEEAEAIKHQLGAEKKDMDRMIHARQQNIREIQHTAEASRNNAAQALSRSERVMTNLLLYVRRSQAELTEVIETRWRSAEEEAKGFVKGLEVDILQMKQKNSQLREILAQSDPFVLLGKFLHYAHTQPQVKGWSEASIKAAPFVAQGDVAQLETAVVREVSMLCDPDFKMKQLHAVDVSLDPDTANACLVVSADGKRVTRGDKRRSVASNAERFDHVFNVLATEGFCSGKFYYEVGVHDKTQWKLGVANQSISRKGDIRLSPQNGYWTIWLRKGSEFAVNSDPVINLPTRERLQKVGVFVDFKEGEVSFYDVDNRASIFSFTKCNFTEKLFPFFCPGPNDDGRNSAPLILTPVDYNS